MRDRGHNQIRLRLFLFAAAGAAVMIAIFAFSSNGGEDSSRQSLFFLNTPLGAWILRNLPALFPGDEELAHQPNEYQDLDRLLQAAGIYANALIRLCGKE